MTAPERVWLSAADSDNEHQVWTDPDEGGTEYVRADLVHDCDPQERFARWIEEGPKLAKAAGCYVGIRIETALRSLIKEDGE